MRGWSSSIWEPFSFCHQRETFISVDKTPIDEIADKMPSVAKAIRFSQLPACVDGANGTHRVLVGAGDCHNGTELGNFDKQSPILGMLLHSTCEFGYDFGSRSLLASLNGFPEFLANSATKA